MDDMPCIMNYCAMGIVERFFTEYGIETENHMCLFKYKPNVITVKNVLKLEIIKTI